MSGPRSQTSVDVHIGTRLRLQRQVLKMSQQSLAEQVGVTFQQLQKYERGTNRVSASRLWELSKILGVPVTFFFKGLVEADVDNPETDTVQRLVRSRDGVKFADVLQKLEQKPAVRRQLLELARSLADN